MPEYVAPALNTKKPSSSDNLAREQTVTVIKKSALSKPKNRPRLTSAERFLNTFRPIFDQHPTPRTSFHKK
jgi:hypothetical protein